MLVRRWHGRVARMQCTVWALYRRQCRAIKKLVHDESPEMRGAQRRKETAVLAQPWRGRAAALPRHRTPFADMGDARSRRDQVARQAAYMHEMVATRISGGFMADDEAIIFRRAHAPPRSFLADVALHSGATDEAGGFHQVRDSPGGMEGF